MGSNNTDWEVEKYKLEHETEEHWELRRNFLLAHKDRFPEDELVCLAQVFTNVELLGCRYPKETMDLIAELSQDVAKDFRKKQKSKLQRTFVKASDAASSKVKGLKSTPSNNIDNSQSISPRQSISHDKNIDCCSLITQNHEIPAKKMKLDVFGNAPFGQMVLFEYPGDQPQSILARAASAFGINLEWKLEKSTLCKYKLYIDDKLVAESFGSSQKDAKRQAATAALNELNKHYYTIKVKKALNPDVSTMSTDSLRKGDSTTNLLSDDNIGRKLMKLMGWTGGGLGKTQQGITEPVTIEQRMSREGLGLKTNSYTMNELKKKCRELLLKFLSGDMKNDLVFSTDFTNEERAVMHQVARQMGVKSQSYGPKNQRTLIFSRKINPQELVMELKELGGCTDKYELIEPTQ